MNDGPSYMNFVIDHPLGSLVEGVVDRFSSHGAYVAVGPAHCYVPLKVLGDPPPRSAREVFKLGEARSFVVQRFDPARRGIDVVPTDTAPARTESGGDAAEAVAHATETPVPIAEEAPVSPAAKKAPAKKAPAKKAPAKKATASRAPARKAATKAATGARSVAKKATAATKTAAKKATAATRTAGKKAPAKAAAKRVTAARSTTAKAPAKKASAAKKAPARKASPAKAAAKKR